MKTKLLPTFIFGIVCATAPLASGQVAVTEFLNNPEGVDTIREFFELFNYSQEPVNIAGWKVSDEETDNPDVIVLTTVDRIIAPGGYLVFSVNKAQMEADYFDGVSQADIIEYDGGAFILANGGDEIILTDADDEVIWSIAYGNDEDSGYATFLSEDDFSTKVWGSKAEPGVDRDENDPASGTLGYQSNQTTADPNAMENETGDTASPLAGFYTAGGGGGTTPDFRILTIVSGSVAGTFDITFESEILGVYSVESSSDLIDFTFESTVAASGATTEVTVTPSVGFDQIFYRILRSEAIGVE